jgi:hypothetical protein
MSPEDLATLPSHLFPYLSIEQVQQIDPKHLDKLIDLQIPFLTPNSFALLKKPEHIRHIPLEHMDKLKPHQYKSLSPAQNAALKKHQEQVCTSNLEESWSQAVSIWGS